MSAPRLRPNESTSSMKMMHGFFALAAANKSRTAFSLSPEYLGGGGGRGKKPLCVKNNVTAYD
jgi:hypothetical protein